MPGRRREWLVRMEDLGRPREVPGAVDAILHTLNALGFERQSPVLRQSTHTQAYAQAIEWLREAGLVFPCACSRCEIAANSRVGVDGPVYPGTCRATAYHRADEPARYACVPSTASSKSGIGSRESCTRT